MNKSCIKDKRPSFVKVDNKNTFHKSKKAENVSSVEYRLCDNMFFMAQDRISTCGTDKIYDRQD